MEDNKQEIQTDILVEGFKDGYLRRSHESSGKHSIVQGYPKFIGFSLDYIHIDVNLKSVKDIEDLKNLLHQLAPCMDSSNESD